MKYLVGAILLTFFFEESQALRCWKCSSDLDPSCRDPFNEYSAGRSRQNSAYDNYNQRQYDNNYNSRYDNQRYDNQRYDNQRYDNQRYDNQRYDNRDLNSGFNYNPGYTTHNRAPVLELCDENEARNRRMRNVCLKEIVRGSNYVSVVRRCELVPYEQSAGACSQSVNRGLLLDFCEYCEYDGCNSATGLKTNIYLAGIISSLALLIYYLY